MVAHTYLKTPTAVAGFIIDIFMQEQMHLSSILQRLTYAINSKCINEQNYLDNLNNKIKNAYTYLIRDKEHKIDLLKMRLASLDVSDTLKRGFAVVYRDGVKLKSIQDINEGEQIDILLEDGILKLRAGEILERKKEKFNYGKE